jgi:hypothetical protein
MTRLKAVLNAASDSYPSANEMSSGTLLVKPGHMATEDMPVPHDSSRKRRLGLYRGGPQPVVSGTSARCACGNSGRESQAFSRGEFGTSEVLN